MTLELVADVASDRVESPPCLSQKKQTAQPGLTRVTEIGYGGSYWVTMGYCPAKDRIGNECEGLSKMEMKSQYGDWGVMIGVFSQA